MSFKTRTDRSAEVREIYRPGGPRPAGAGALPAEDELRKRAEEILEQPAVREFLDSFPQEAEAVLAEITRFLALESRRLAAHAAAGRRRPVKAARRTWRDKFLAELLEKIARYRQTAELLGPLQEFLGSGWDLSAGDLHRTAFDLWRRSDEILRREPQIQDIARLLGRLEEAETRQRAARLARATPAAWAFQRAGRSSLVGVHESDDLAALVSGEAALLSTPETSQLFWLRFAEKKLLTYDYNVEEKSAPPAGRRPARRLRKGPMILALDTSGSMEGWADEQAKAFALSLLRIAFRQRRKVHVLSFSTRVAALTFSPPRISLPELAKFLLLSFHGGTDAGRALDAGLALLQQEDWSAADLLFLTDAEVPAFARKQVEAMQAARRRGTRFYGLVLGSAGEGDFLAQLDRTWRYDGKNLGEVVRGLGSAVARPPFRRADGKPA